MILYFTGTGNSEYAAHRIAEITGDVTLNLFEKIRSQELSELTSDSPWIIVTPTYAWRIPRLVHQWLMNARLSGNQNVYFVMTCGGSIGNAAAYLKKLCRTKAFNYKGCAEIVMPENYIALYSAPPRQQALSIIGDADKVLIETAHLIKKGELLPPPAVTPKDRIQSGLINAVFYPAVVGARKFYAGDDCISCGKCVKVCPLNNIQLHQGKPQWGKNCTHCMACICRCPQETIEYGTHTLGKLRYTCPANGKE